MADNKDIKRVEEKSLSSLEFTYQGKKSVVSIIKKLQIDVISLGILIAVCSFAGYAYFWKKSEIKTFVETSAKQAEYATAYDSLKKQLEETKDITPPDFSGELFVKIFKFLEESGLETFKLVEAKKVGSYQVVIDKMEVNALQALIDDGFKKQLLDNETRKTFTILEPGFAGATLTFKK